MTAQEITRRIQEVLGEDVSVAVGPQVTRITPRPTESGSVRYIAPEELEQLKTVLHTKKLSFEYKDTWILGPGGPQLSGEYEIRVPVGHATKVDGHATKSDGHATKSDGHATKADLAAPSTGQVKS